MPERSRIVSLIKRKRGSAIPARRAHRGQAYVALLGLRSSDLATMLGHIDRGLPMTALDAFERNVGLPVAQVTGILRIPSRTWTRRREQGRLSRDESDRLLRLARLFGSAIGLFDGDVAAARQWLSKPRRALGGAVPLDLAGTDIGTEAVERLIRQIEHGVFV